MLTRRDLIKTTMGMSAVAATQAWPTNLLAGDTLNRDEAAAAKQAGLIGPAPSLDAAGFSNEAMDEEVEALVRYYHQLHRRIKRDNVMRACSAPFATMPVNVYTRMTKQMLGLPEPATPHVHLGMLGAQPWSQYPLDYLAARVAERLGIIPAGVELVPAYRGIDLRMPDGEPAPRDRVLSPCYVQDVDDAHFSTRITAAIFLDIVTGIWQEWDSKIKAAREAAAEMPGQPGEQRMQITTVTFSLGREAFMIECFAYNVGAGFIHTPLLKG